jgi:hypothetical protein
MKVMEYYTYAYLREDKTPYYIGKGKGNRIHKRHMVPIPSEDRILFLKKNLTEEDAKKHEIYMINVLGRKNLGTGILRNLTGGGEGSSGRKLSKETIERMSIAARNRKISDEGRKKLSERSKRIGKWQGSDNPFYGKPGINKGIPMSDEQKDNLRKKAIGRKVDRKIKEQPNCKKIRVYFISGEVIECWGVREFKRQYGYYPKPDTKTGKFYGKSKNILKVETIF